MVAQATGVNRSRGESMSQSVHGQQRCVSLGIAEIIHELSLGEFRARGRFYGDTTQGFAFDFIFHKRKAEPCKVGASTEWGNDDVRIISGIFQLLFCFLADDGLMEQYMVENRTQCVFGLFVGYGHFDGFGYRQAQAPWRIWIGGECISSRLCVGGGRRINGCTKGIHQNLAIGLLIETDAHHIHLAVNAKLAASETECRTPLACTGLGNDAFYTFLFAIISLWNGGIWFMG